MDDDSPETTTINPSVSANNKKRRSFVILLPLFILSSPFFALFLAVLLGPSSIDSPISFSSKCKIVSTGVDLRSSKVCELGLLNYKAKNVFYPFERKKFRCHFDYYWASVFKVEYIDHSGQAQLAFAETPNEALPLDCRPNFGAAWLTKDRFKVNETYDCWYTLGISKVNLSDNGFFNCQAKDPSRIEMLRRYSILFMKILQSLLSSRRGNRSWSSWRWGMAAGIITGFSTSLLTLSLARFIQVSCLPHIRAVRIWPQAVRVAHLKQACFFVAYFSFMGWLVFQYVKRLGFPNIFTRH